MCSPTTEPEKGGGPVGRKLKENSGAALLLVLCLGALFVSLSAAMVYAAGQLTASANRLYWEQDAYRQARSFSECIEEELCGGGDTALKGFVNNTFLRGLSYAENTAYRFAQTGEAAPGFAPLTVTLSKEILLATGDNRGAISFETADAALQWAKSYAVVPVNDCAVTVQVTAQGEEAACTYTQIYLRTGIFPLVFLVDGTEYQAGADGKLYRRGVSNPTVYQWDKLLNQELTYYFDTNMGSELKFEREGGPEHEGKTAGQ